MRVWAVNGTKWAWSSLMSRAADAILLLGQNHDGAPLRRLVSQRGELGRIGEVLLGDAPNGPERGRLAVAERDGPGLVEQERIHVAGRLDGAARHGQDIEANQAVHPGDADGGQQRADRGRDQGDEQSATSTSNGIDPPA